MPWCFTRIYFWCFFWWCFLWCSLWWIYFWCFTRIYFWCFFWWCFLRIWVFIRVYRFPSSNWFFQRFYARFWFYFRLYFFAFCLTILLFFRFKYILNLTNNLFSLIFTKLSYVRIILRRWKYSLFTSHLLKVIITRCTNSNCSWNTIFNCWYCQ